MDTHIRTYAHTHTQTHTQMHHKTHKHTSRHTVVCRWPRKLKRRAAHKCVIYRYRKVAKFSLVFWLGYTNAWTQAISSANTYTVMELKFVELKYFIYNSYVVCEWSLMCWPKICKQVITEDSFKHVNMWLGLWLLIIYSGTQEFSIFVLS